MTKLVLNAGLMYHVMCTVCFYSCVYVLLRKSAAVLASFKPGFGLAESFLSHSVLLHKAKMAAKGTEFIENTESPSSSGLAIIQEAGHILYIKEN